MAEEGEWETAHDRYWLYADIAAKMENVRDELMRSGNNAECLARVLRALKFWPGTVKFFTQDKRREIAAILNQAQETLDAEGTGIWHQIEEIVQLLVPSEPVRESLPAPAGRMPQGDETWREGGVEGIKRHADITTLLRQMRQLCV